jgi:hypothetical protein
MKFLLTFVFCSGVAGKCLAPMEYPDKYVDLYTCLDAGYRESIVQLQGIGKEEESKGSTPPQYLLLLRLPYRG